MADIPTSALFFTQNKPCEEALDDLIHAYNSLADRIEEAWATIEQIERERDKRIEDLNEACRQYVGELEERTRERDEALHAEDVAERYREALEVEKRNLRVEADTFMETAKFHAKKVKALEAALREIADTQRHKDTSLPYKERYRLGFEIARRALDEVKA